MKTPQEITVWYILPALRRELTIELKNRNLLQKQIAKVLDVTEPAVSQYMRNKRAKTVEFPQDLKKEIHESANNMIDDLTCHRFELQKLITQIKRSGFLCKIHRKHENVPKCCNVCINNQKGEC
ncbi:helix-turn-helix domain-containing protein [Candidatus Woesearchaeota archaeon]|nr:helix-turn-helix domain-containing protein [Candidatus Woesearchaeota archaeon]